MAYDKSDLEDLFDILPDIDSFYEAWLGRPLGDKKEFKDLTHEVIRGWAGKE